MSEHESQWFYIIYELHAGGDHADNRIYEMVHAEGGYHFLRDAQGGWGRLPRRTVALPLQATNPQLARIAFELKLAHLDLLPVSIVVVTGESAIQSRPVQAAQIPPYAAIPTRQPRALPTQLAAAV